VQQADDGHLERGRRPPRRLRIGKLITQINVGYDQKASTGGYRGFIDDVRISE
jgi:hypothetical protein